VAIVMLVTWLLVRGVRESAQANNVMVWIKLVVLALFLGVGAFHGWTGIHQGAAIVFFAFIGFDAVSTAAEETRNPQRDMPRGILGALAICTLIYVLVGLVATGLVPYKELASGSDPLARALAGVGLAWLQLVLSVGAVVSMTAVLLVFQLGQPRIFFSMARDGLLPRYFARVHPEHGTPYVTTIVTGLVVALGAALMDDDATYDLSNIGTLFARLRRRDGAARHPARRRAPVPGPARVDRGAARGRGLRLHDARLAGRGVGAVRHLAGGGTGPLLPPHDHRPPGRRLSEAIPADPGRQIGRSCPDRRANIPLPWLPA
jgi:hypothetical protein